MHPLRRVTFVSSRLGWWESGSEGALAKSGYGANSSSQANTPIGVGSPMSVREVNGKKSKLLYAKDDSMGNRLDRLHFSERSSPRAIPIPVGASTAPLATPENIEVGVDYMTVKDALGGMDPKDYVEDEAQYATVASVLPPPTDQSKPRKKTEVQRKNKTCSQITVTLFVDHVPFTVAGDSSSGESLEKTNVYEKTGRKPTPHRRDNKKKSSVGPSIAERVRQLNASATDTAPVPPSPPPPLPPYTRERLFKSGNSQLSGTVYLETFQYTPLVLC